MADVRVGGAPFRGAGIYMYGISAWGALAGLGWEFSFRGGSYSGSGGAPRVWERPNMLSAGRLSVWGAPRLWFLYGPLGVLSKAGDGGRPGQGGAWLVFYHCCA